MRTYNASYDEGYLGVLEVPQIERYLFPCVFLAEPGGSYAVVFPDLENQGAYSCGSNIREAYKNAREVLEMVLRQMKKEGTPIPEPSKPEDITWHNEYEGYGGFVSLIEAWMENEDNERNRSVRVNCTIPRWMKEYADEEGLNYSQILQNGIRRQLHIEHVSG